MTNLFTPIKIGNLQLPNRIFMAPLTRARAGESRIANELMAEYYAQRASAGLIISEATAISEQGYGWANAPAMYNDTHQKAWEKTTEAVRAKGGHIFLQLWHMGRISHPDFQNGELPVGPSAIAAKGDAHTLTGKKPYVTPRPLELSELPGVVKSFAEGAKRAIDAGFHGVEIHNANGYLLDQFLRDGANQRTDQYGGSPENRARLTFEVIEAVIKAVGEDKTAIRFSPRGTNGDLKDSDPITTYSYVAEKLNDYNLAYVHIMEGLPGSAMAAPGERVSPTIRERYKGIIITNGGYNKDKGNAAIGNNEADAVAYGALMIANPDLVERFKTNAKLNTPDIKTFYAGGPKGYTDYPFLEQKAA